MIEELAHKIDQFVNGQIQRSELISGLSADELSEVEEQLQIIEDIRVAEELKEVRSQVKELGIGEKASDKVFKLSSLYKYIGVAAAVIFLLVTYNIFKDQGHPLLEEYANIKEGLPTMMSDAQHYDFDNAMTFFKEGNYKTALEKFETVEASKDIGQDTLDYFMGLCHFHLRGYSEAIDLLDSLEPSSAYKSKSLWYVLMSYVAQEDRTLVDEQLKLILSDPGHPYIDRARSFQSSWADYKKLKFGEE